MKIINKDPMSIDFDLVYMVIFFKLSILDLFLVPDIINHYRSTTVNHIFVFLHLSVYISADNKSHVLDKLNYLSKTSEFIKI